MNYFKKILRFARPYAKYAWLNMFFNILYAIFNVLSVLTFIPVLGILFGKDEKVTEKGPTKNICPSFFQVLAMREKNIFDQT